MVKMLKLLNWFKKNTAILLGSFAIFVMFACFVSGCCYHKNHSKCPEITTNTIILHDPYWYHIADSLSNLPPKEKIKWQPQDTFFTPSDTFFKNVDTAAILKNHFSVFRYKWDKLDTGKLELNLFTTISENKPLKYELDYKILQPQTIINNTQDNSIHYAKYIYAGFDLPFKNIEYASVDVLYAFSRGYLGFGYIPLQKGLSLKGGVNLFKWQ